MRQRPKDILIISFLIIGIVFFSIITQTLLSEASGFTELSFSDFRELPREIELNRAYDFSYVVYNLDSVDHTYAVRVILVTDERQRILSQRVLAIKQNSYNVVVDSFVISEEFEEGMVRVELTNHDNSIYFRFRRAFS